MEIKPVSLFVVDSIVCQGTAATSTFMKETILVGCFYSKVKEKQQQGPGGAGFFVWGFFCSSSVCYREVLGAECPEGLRAEQQAADHKQAWEFQQASVRTWVRREREFGWGFVGLLVLGVF